MFSQPIRSILEPSKLLTATPHTTVREAAERMANGRVGALLVVEDGRLVGIFCEADAVFRVLARGLDPLRTLLAQVMTPAPRTISADQPIGCAMSMMHAHGIRHLPVLEDGRLIGIVSARSALDPDLEEFVCEERRRRHFQAAH